MLCLKYALGPIESKKIGLNIDFFFHDFWFEQRWSNFGRRKKVTNFSRNCSLRTFKYDLSKKKVLKKFSIFLRIVEKKVG